MSIRFTQHAERKFKLLLKYGVHISRRKIMDTLLSSEYVDYRTRAPLIIAQGPLDQNHVLRVVYRQEGNIMVVITFYPGRKSQYEKK
jgi:hypothetical protein